MSYLSVDLLAQARDATYFSSLVASNLTTPGISLLSYSPQFPSVLGESASARQVADLPWRAFHESGIYNKKDNALYITSNYRNLEESINITIVSLDDHSVRSSRFPNLSEANGGSSYYPPGADQTQTPPQHVYCDQGHLERYSQLLAVDPNRNTSEVLLTNYQGRNFSSINDVRQHPVTGDLWFTDTSYGHIQSFRPEPSLPQQVYRFEPSTGVVQAVADGFVQPNGLEFSPDFQTLYVSDTGAQGYHFNATGPATIYAYDVVEQKMLSNRRIFAFADSGFPDGIHCDTNGNVWAGCGDGVHVWDPVGKLLGKIFLGETSNNFAFAPGKLFVFSDYRLWVVENVTAVGREVCKDFGVGCT